LKYSIEASSKSGDNVYRLFSDAAKFLFLKFGMEDDLSAAGSNSFAASASNMNSVLSNNRSNNRGTVPKEDFRAVSMDFGQPTPQQ